MSAREPEGAPRAGGEEDVGLEDGAAREDGARRDPSGGDGGAPPDPTAETNGAAALDDGLADALGAPVAVPRSVEELSALMARASREGRRVRCIGNATSPPPGHLAAPVDLVVSTRALRTVHAYDPADLTLSADAGVTLGELERLTGEQGQWLPLDPPRRRRRSLGGVLASAAYGPLQGKFGTPRDHVLGLTLVTGDGRVLELGGRVVKNVAGYDLVKLAVGSGGRLGIVTSATVRLHPLPVRDVTLIYQTRRLGLAVVLARSLGTAPVRIPALELVAGHAEGPAVAARLLGSPEAVEESERLICGRVGREASRRLEGEASARWFAALERFEDDAAAVARISHLPSLLGDLAEPCVECGAVAAHVSLGVLRVAVGAGHTSEFDALTRLRDDVVRVGATFRVARANIPRWPGPKPASSPGVLALTRGIVESFDPAGVLAPPAS